MKKQKHTYITSSLAAGLLLLSAIFMVLILPAVYSDSIPNEYNTGAFIGIVLAIVIRVLFFIITVRLYNNIKWSAYSRKNADYFVVTGILTLLFGLLYTDGALAFYNKEPFYVASFMFASVCCDFFSGIFLFITAFVYRKK